ncbi:P pilus assembly protein, chaperone PapD [Fischerella thermalis]|uniref:P pilus assembly protein, chaperone PapD n=1 Tax=Fischerella thermalis TaxID=372787 RepID=UPI000E0A6414|nr:P pilus assembly protein, chaperone PapD [Fischerella thermalis]RDH50660.1 P pilus assembly protein, chaperone PapD [Fischerella thermalis 111/344/542]
MIRTVILLGICSLSAVISARTVQAQVRISPMVIETQVNRNQAEGVINVTNITNEPFRARVYVQPFAYNRDTGFETLSSSPTDLSPYLQFSPRELIVPPGTTRRIRLIAQLPPHLPEGEYRVVVFTENLQEMKTSDQKGNVVNIRGKVGSTFYVRKGKLSPQLIIDSSSFDLEKNQIKLLVRNIGKASVLPTATWTLKQQGSIIRSGKIQPTGITALSDRYLFLNLADTGKTAIAPGKYELSGELIWGQAPNQTSLPFNMNLIVPSQ